MTRIATSFLFAQGVNAMLERQAELSNTELQLATGKRILKPSDDAAASVQILDLKESESKLKQYQRNADAVSAKLTQEEAALEGVQNLLQRVRELAVQGNNGTYGAEDRATIAKEIRQQMDNFLQQANTKDANGEYIFAGFKTDTEPFSHDGAGNFSYAGDTGQRLVKIGETREVAMGDSGDVFMDFAASAGGTTNVGKIIYDLAVNFESNSADGNALTDIDTALGQVLNTRATVGARVNAVEDQKIANDAINLAIAQVRSSLEDLDYTEAISRFNQQLTAFQASQQSFLKIQDLSLFNFI